MTPREEHRLNLKKERARMMRDLPEDERNEAIEAASNVIDLRPTLDFNARQRHLASAYRKPILP